MAPLSLVTISSGREAVAAERQHAGGACAPDGGEGAAEAVLCPETLPAAEVQGLYVHVPFCAHKCHYCDFYSITRQDEGRMERFVDRILAEAAGWAGGGGGGAGVARGDARLAAEGMAAKPSVRLRTVFVGGGTPTALPRVGLKRLIDGLRGRFGWETVAEFTVEVNPATATLDYCRMLRDAGVDRLSFGAQSFNVAELKVLERHHEPADVGRSVELARAAGFERINLDLIYAIPGQDLRSWDESLSAALAMGTTHLSCYGLTYEPNTPMAVRRRLGQLTAVVEEDAEMGMFRHTRKRLQDAGLRAYEISNFATPGEECRHNLHYWTGGSYIGLGPSAASHVEGWRWRNRPHLREWEEAVDAGRLPATDVEHLSPRRRAGELAMLQLRLSRGIDLAEFTARTSFNADELFVPRLSHLRDLGLIDHDGTSIRLTDQGLAVADAVAAEFLADND